MELSNESVNSKSESSEPLSEESFDANSEPIFQKEHKTQRSCSFYNLFCIIFIAFAVSFMIYITAFEIVLKPISVSGFSMQPTINANAKGVDGDVDNDYVYYSTDLKNLSYGDIIIIGGTYTGKSRSIIKRIIACPGQTIRFKVTNEYIYRSSGVYAYVDVYVDGVLLDETSETAPYKIKSRMELLITPSIDNVIQSYTTFSYNLTAYGEVEYNLGDNEYFVMGDNRRDSTDSRYFGPIRFDDIEGKVVLLIPYGENLVSVLFKKIFG